MPLVTMKNIMESARRRKYAIGAFDVSNYEMIRSVTEAAEEAASPVILSALAPDIKGKGIKYFTAMVRVAADTANIPVCMHLDHVDNFELIKVAIDNGFTSVMFDGSKLPYEENMERTREICDYARSFGITVEAELGHVTDAIAGSGESVLGGKPEHAGTQKPEDFLTDVDEAADFLLATGVDALAVAIGTAHGVYISKPKLDFDRLQAINKISRVPLVLHGGSGTPDEDIMKAIELGICKINIFSEVLHVFNSTMKDVLNRLQNMSSWPCIVYREPVAAMKAKVREKLKLFGSEGKA